MGPAREILLTTLDDRALDLIHASLIQISGKVKSTRKGRAWDVWINDHPFHIEADMNSMTITLSAGCNQSADHPWVEKITSVLKQTLNDYVVAPES